MGHREVGAAEPPQRQRAQAHLNQGQEHHLGFNMARDSQEEWNEVRQGRRHHARQSGRNRAERPSLDYS